MSKRTIFIILGALLFVVLIALAWWWLGRWSEEERGPAEGFGSAQERPGGNAGADGQTNVGTGLGGANTGASGGTNTSVSTDGTIVYDNSGVPNVGYGGGGSSSGGVIRGGVTVVPGANWLPSGPVSNFTPSQVNQLNDGSIGGQVSILGTPPQPNTTVGLGTALAGAGIGTALCTAGLLSSSLGATGSGVLSSLPSIAGAVQTNSLASNALLSSNELRNNFYNCIARTIARAALQQITASTVNWINSGFNGKPSFVQNYQQFFTNVADQAAGEYIRGSALSFLCSPFGNKIRIALAQSYANRNAAASCTLTRVSNNLQGFMNGNFGAGGWAGLLQFTTVPTNNPFGAYSYAQGGLSSAQAVAVQNGQLQISPGGFLSQQDCTGPLQTSGPNAGKRGPPCKITTPGATIEATLAETLQVDKKLLTQAGVSGSFDTIINALLQQLTIRALQGGVSNLSGLNGYEGNFLTPDQRQAQTQGNALLAQLQGISNTAGQYGSVAQGAIADIQNTQERLQQLVNCYESKGQATQGDPARARIAELEQRVAFYNARITRANEVITLLQGYQTRVLQITTLAQATAVQNEITAAQAAGQLIATTDVTTAQQDRTTLQTELAATNSQTDVSITQCRAS